MTESRTKNTKRNMVSGMLLQITNIILPFIVRTIILYVLGEEYQGLNGLFTSILQVLNLIDLGFSSAVVYILYKPIANEDYDVVCAIMAYFKKIYQIIGFVILALGMIIFPFLPFLIKGEYPNDINIYILYLIYLFNSVISYWLFAYKSALLTAMQRADIVNNISTITRGLLNFIQICVLLIYKNYYVYIIFLPLLTIVNNILLEIISKKVFPSIIPNGQIPNQIKHDLIKQVKGIVINRIGDVARNGADNIFLSALIGLTAVAVYNNYFYIYSALYGISLTLANSMSASVGNCMVKESQEKNYHDMCKFTYIFSWFTGWCTICMCCLYQPFMKIWMRGNESLMLSNYDMLLFCIYFYAITMNNIRNQYLNGAGIYWELRYWYFFEAIGNVVLNFLLGYFWGTTGILIATLITIILFNFISRTNVLFKLYFKDSPAKYYIQHLSYIVVTILCGIITYVLCEQIYEDGIKGLFLRMLICIVVPNIFYLLVYFRTSKFKESIAFAKQVIKRR